jgi:8-oxo-dGTP pyrophosphatase MutT (NUDIX family)
MVVRDGANDGAAGPLEVLMVRRSLNSDFVRGAYVFPGGAVDPADAGTGADAVCVGRSDEAASALLGLEAGGRAYWVAAIRECFEEAGILIAVPRATASTDASGPLLSLAERGAAARFARAQGELNAGSLGFSDLCRREGLVLDLARVHYFAHWITPENPYKRFDTRFFVTLAPLHQTPAHDAAETIAHVWVRPATAIERHRRGEIELILPTIRTLEAIGRFSTSAELVAVAAAASARVPTVEPRVVPEGNGVRILVPGDEDYAEPPKGPHDVVPDAPGAIRDMATPVEG